MISFKYLQKILPGLYARLPLWLNPRFAFPPLHAYFEITYRCNLRCEMCHYLEIIEETESGRKYGEELSAAEVERALSALPRRTVVTFTGGEAFMKSDFLDILKFAASRHKVHVITNGTLFQPPVVEQILDLRMRSLFGSGLFYVGVSLEGGEALHDRVTTIPGSFRKTRRGLEELTRRRAALKSRYPLIHLTCVINRGNVRDLVPLYEYAESMGVEVCNFVVNNTATYWHGKNYNQDDFLRRSPAPVQEIDPGFLRTELLRLEVLSRKFRTQLRYSPNGITVEELVRYYSNRSSYRDYRCHIPWSKVAFSAYGDVHSCPHYRLGHFPDEHGGIPWHGERAREFRELLAKEKIFPGCLGCCQSEYVGSPQSFEPVPVLAGHRAAPELMKLKPTARELTPT
ncbi:MAG: radical SAM protein [Nitrospinae bacterium CG11_big_fil_rev_8_21_14_0_20_56_8]|nr:MAG: radical SAM protein [Nitrospinae bacterium CG11_big_fil_rev_8_21_14_0_20_56_8]